MSNSPLHRHALAVRKRRSHILRMRREGYKIWRIAEVVGVEPDYVANVLVRDGLLPLGNIETILHFEKKARRRIYRREVATNATDSEK